MMMREFVVKTGLLSATIMVSGLLILTTTTHAESKDSIFGKPVDHDFSAGGDDPSKGPGFLDSAVIRLGNTVIRTGGAQQGNSQDSYNAEKARKARKLQNRSIDATTPN